MWGGLKKYVDFVNRRTKKLVLEIGGPKVQKYVNKGTKCAFKPKVNYSRIGTQHCNIN
jgi:hypothetical protein